MFQNISDLLRLRSRSFGVAIFFVGASVIINSCKKSDGFLGIDVLPKEDVLGTSSTDTLSLTTYTILEDSARSNSTSVKLLGSYTDPEFGYVQAGIYTQVRLSSEGLEIGTVSSTEIDSVILSLQYHSVYGDVDAQTFIVYELTEDMHIDTAYYSNRSIPTKTFELGKIENSNPALNDSMDVGGSMEPAQLRIPLYNYIGETLLAAADGADNTSFLSTFKGVYIAPDTTKNQMAGTGGIFYFNMNSSFSKITVYYNNGLDYDFNINSSCASFSRFEQDYTGTPIASQLLDSTAGQSEFYVHSMGGLRTEIRIPYLSALVNSSYKAILKAELKFTVKEQVEEKYYPHSQLYLRGRNESGADYDIADSFEASSHYGGVYNVGNQQYVFNVTRYIQEFVTDQKNGEDNNYGLFLSSAPVAGGSWKDAHRVTLFGQDNASGGVTLSISYTTL